MSWGGRNGIWEKSFLRDFILHNYVIWEEIYFYVLHHFNKASVSPLIFYIAYTLCGGMVVQKLCTIFNESCNSNYSTLHSYNLLHFLNHVYFHMVYSIYISLFYVYNNSLVNSFAKALKQVLNIQYSSIPPNLLCILFIILMCS